MNDKIHVSLLLLAKSNNDYLKHFKNLNEIISVLNELPIYKNIHKRILPLLRSKAISLGILDKLNDDVQTLLYKSNIDASVEELAKEKQLIQVVDLLISESIEVILLKGTAFSSVIYPPHAIRSSNDIDILVKACDWQKAKSVILSVMDPIPIEYVRAFDNLYEESFVPKGKVGGVLDLHKMLIHPKLFSIQEEELWDNSIESPKFNNKGVRMLSPEHALLHQALHAFKDLNFCKYNIVDSNEIIEFYSPDIEKTIHISHKWGASVALYFLFKNVNEIMGAEISQSLINTIKPNALIEFLIKKILASNALTHTVKNKPISYRVLQVLSQFLFTKSIVNPIKLQYLFLEKSLKQQIVK